MKKIFVFASLMTGLVACSDNTASTTTNTDTTTSVTTMPTTDNGTGTVTTSTSNTASTTTYSAAEGDVSRRDGKVVVYRNNAWQPIDKEEKLDNGATVSRTGRVTYNGEDRDLDEGETVTRTGNFFDKAGNAIGNAWDATKRGVKKGAEKVGNAAEKVGDKAKDLVTDDDKKKQ